MAVGRDRERPYAKVDLMDAKLLLFNMQRLSTELGILVQVKESIDQLCDGLRLAIDKAETVVQHRQENFAPRPAGQPQAPTVVAAG